MAKGAPGAACSGKARETRPGLADFPSFAAKLTKGAARRLAATHIERQAGAR